MCGLITGICGITLSYPCKKPGFDAIGQTKKDARLYDAIRRGKNRKHGEKHIPERIDRSAWLGSIMTALNLSTARNSVYVWANTALPPLLLEHGPVALPLHVNFVQAHRRALNC